MKHLKTIQETIDSIEDAKVREKFITTLSMVSMACEEEQTHILIKIANVLTGQKMIYITELIELLNMGTPEDLDDMALTVLQLKGTDEQKAALLALHESE